RSCLVNKRMMTTTLKNAENLVFSSDKTSNMDKISSSLYVILENKEDKNNNDIDTILDVVELWEE
ncbi:MULTISPECIES: hypothetical protein, partial [Vibrio]